MAEKPPRRPKVNIASAMAAQGMGRVTAADDDAVVSEVSSVANGVPVAYSQPAPEVQRPLSPPQAERPQASAQPVERPVLREAVSAVTRTKKTVDRTNRTFRASDAEFRVLTQLRRRILIEGDLSFEPETSDVIRCALRMLGDQSTDAICEELQREHDG